MNLGVIPEFISYRASLGGAERLGPAVAPGAAGATGAAGGGVSAGRELSGQYPPEYMARRMQSDDMKNAKTFLQYGPLSAATLETFDQWREDLVRAARSVNLTEPAHWATINRLIETRLEHSIYQTVVDLIPAEQREIEMLDPNDLLDRIEARLITSDQLELKRIEFKVAKQKDGESLWQFENRLLALQKRAKITDDSRFVETYKKGLLNNKLRENLFMRETPITTKADLKKAVAAAQVGLLQYARTYTNPPASATAGLGAIQKEELETRRKTSRQVTEVLKRYGPITTNSAEEETPMELDAIQRDEEESGEEYEEESEEEVDEVLFFMEPNHDKIRAREDLEIQEYWEAGIMAEIINVLKRGNMDHS